MVVVEEEGTVGEVDVLSTVISGSASYLVCTATLPKFSPVRSGRRGREFDDPNGERSTDAHIIQRLKIETQMYNSNTMYKIDINGHALPVLVYST